MSKGFLFSLCAAMIFFFVALLTLKDYGINWDEPIHFYRGQAYLHYFLTGKPDYRGFPKIAEHMRARESTNYLEKGYVSVKDYPRSYYQDDSLTATYFLKDDSGHPPLNGILASLSNYVFYQRLRVMGDIDSFHLFNIFVSSILVFVVFHFAYKKYNLLTAVVSGVALVSYPLFFAESRFNIKDPAEAAFFAATIWAFWMSVESKSSKWLFISVLSCALALGTKFNIFFLPFILGPYVLLRFSPIIRGGIKKIVYSVTKIPRPYLAVLLLAPVIIMVIFVGTWPYLWQDPLGNFLKIVGYYKEIGTGDNYQPGYFVKGFNLYPLIWIVSTTPPIVLLLSAFGLLYCLRNIREKDKTSMLLLLWLIVPIARVTVPGASIYGGVRQIMEYIPALALIAGIGANSIYKYFKNSKIVAGILIILFIPHFFVLSTLHPNENVYFNFIVGGLSGASAKHIPYWGNSFGNAYWQAIQWLNANGEPNAKVALLQGTGLNLPQMQLRADIQYWNNFWSGINREGEYVLELTHDDPVKVYPYAWSYVEKMLKPVYEVKVEGVAIAKLWKNDLAHTVAEYQVPETKWLKKMEIKHSGTNLFINLNETAQLSRLSINFEKNATCMPITGDVYTSVDGKNWLKEPEVVPFPQISGPLTLSEHQMNYFFVARPASFLRFDARAENSCLFQKTKVEVYYLPSK